MKHDLHADSSFRLNSLLSQKNDKSHHEYLTSIPYLQQPGCYPNLHSAPVLWEERSIILKLLLQVTDFYITPNETCLLQIHPSTLRKLPCHEYFDTWSWEGKFLCFSDTNSTLMATRILWKFDCYLINHCDTFLAHHWLTSFWHQFKFVLTKKNFVTTKFCSTFFIILLRLP